MNIRNVPAAFPAPFHAAAAASNQQGGADKKEKAPKRRVGPAPEKKPRKVEETGDKVSPPPAVPPQARKRSGGALLPTPTGSSGRYVEDGQQPSTSWGATGGQHRGSRGHVQPSVPDRDQRKRRHSSTHDDRERDRSRAGKRSERGHRDRSRSRSRGKKERKNRRGGSSDVSEDTTPNFRMVDQSMVFRPHGCECLFLFVRNLRNFLYYLCDNFS